MRPRLAHLAAAQSPLPTNLPATAQGELGPLPVVLTRVVSTREPATTPFQPSIRRLRGRHGRLLTVSLPAAPQVEVALHEVRGAEPHGVSSPETDASLLAVLDPTRLAGPDAQSWLVVLRTGDSESPPPARAPRYRVRMPHTRRVQLDLPDEPHAVAERLRACARWRLFPYRGSWLGGDRPLGGRVSDTGFRLALDPRDLRQLSQAVAVGTLTPDGRGGTRLVADVGLPAWATWAYRLSWITALAVTGFAAAQLSAAGLPPLQLAALVTLFLGVGLVAGTLGIGAHVAHADAQVDPLADALEAACRGGRTAAPEVGRQRSPPRQAE